MLRSTAAQQAHLHADGAGHAGACGLLRPLRDQIGKVPTKQALLASLSEKEFHLCPSIMTAALLQRPNGRPRRDKRSRQRGATMIANDRP